MRIREWVTYVILPRISHGPISHASSTIWGIMCGPWQSHDIIHLFAYRDCIWPAWDTSKRQNPGLSSQAHHVGLVIAFSASKILLSSKTLFLVFAVWRGIVACVSCSQECAASGGNQTWNCVQPIMINQNSPSYDQLSPAITSELIHSICRTGRCQVNLILLFSTIFTKFS